MLRIGSTVAVLEQPIRPKRIVVWTARRRGNRKRKVQDGGLEDTLRGDERNPVAPEVETLRQEVAREHVTVDLDLLVQPLEGGKPNLTIDQSKRVFSFQF